MKNKRELLLDIFKEFKVPKEGILKPQMLYEKIRSWDMTDQETAQHAINSLIAEGYIGFDGNNYILLKKGYDHIFKDYSLQDTIDIILYEFKKRKIGADQLLTVNSIHLLQQSVDRFHFDNFSQALQQLQAKNFIKQTSLGYKLTKAGYDEIN